LWRSRAARNVVDEIEFLVDQYQPNLVLFPIGFIDSNFLGHTPGDLNHAKDIAAEVLRRGLAITFTICCRADGVNRVSDELLHLLMRAGLISVYVGVEAGEQETLDLYNERGISPSVNLFAQRRLVKAGLRHTLGLIMFHPLSTLAQIRTTVAFMSQIDASPLRFANQLRMYSGIHLVNSFSETGLLRGIEHHYQYWFKHNDVALLNAMIARYRQTALFNRIVSMMYYASIWPVAISRLVAGANDKVRGHRQKVLAELTRINQADHDFFLRCIDLAASESTRQYPALAIEHSRETVLITKNMWHALMTGLDRLRSDPSIPEIAERAEVLVGGLDKDLEAFADQLEALVSVVAG
jgi:Radical SAM superfamily